MFALPKRLTQALGKASPAQLEELASRWIARLRSEDSTNMTGDDLLVAPTRGPLVPDALNVIGPGGVEVLGEQPRSVGCGDVAGTQLLVAVLSAVDSGDHVAPLSSVRAQPL
ncbi:hypothetical protein [Streptomyces sp. NPDC002825]|uniref:hypothetical protein n=1 Tax=Streptomyces sp. NPDC002825 TaxID=3154666 RepID=UPI00331819EE